MPFVIGIGTWAFIVLIAGLVADDREVILGSFLVLLACWLAVVLYLRTEGQPIADEPGSEDWRWPERIML